MLCVDRTQKRHYGDDQGRYWSVSQVCDVVAGKHDHYAAGAADRGTAVHEIFTLRLGYIIGACDAPDVPEEYAGYDRGIALWINEAKPQPMMIQRMLRHKTLPYAGEVDFAGMIGEEYGVLDLKTGGKERRHMLQVHGYQKMLDKATKMWLLYIDANGHYEQVSVKPNPRDWAAFQNGLSVLQWREG